MKKILLASLILANILYAQIGIGQNMEGVRVPTANTLSEGYFFISGYYESVSDGHALAMDGYLDENTGKRFPLDKNTPSSGGALTLAFGARDNLELMLSLPFYYDGEINGTNLDGFGAGDLEISVKYSYPIQTVPINLAFFSGLTLPTGARETGFRPRHQWFIYDQRKSYAYTAAKWSIFLEGIVSIDLFNIINWNTYIGYFHVLNAENYTALWGSGVELFPKKIVSAVLEVTAETSLFRDNPIKSLMNDVFRVTPAVKIHLPDMLNLMLGMDVGFDFVRKPTLDNSLEISRKHDDHELKYNIRGTPEFSMILAVTKTLDFSRKDADNDGVIDRFDLCPNTELSVAVNNRGCPVDLDQDGVLNIFDNCPETPRGVAVDYFGCPIDSDSDGVPDYQDQCKSTPAGTAVNSDGCMLDSDGDGVDDYHDKCPNSLSRDKVDEEGCPLDDDHDGVLNDRDSCPETPRGYSVDQIGCPLDFDHDGVPNDIDMCPNSHENEIVDEDGCPADLDRDGVPDSRDECSGTPRGFAVDQNGCPSDHDQDGIPDALDKCPNTPARAPVDSTGCPIDSDGDEVLDYMDMCPATFPNVIVGQNGCPLNPKNNLNAIALQVRFKNNSEALLNSSYTALNDVIYLMRRFNFNLDIQCSSPAGQDVSDQQAQAIADYIIEKGIDKKRIRARGFGTKLPQGDEFKNWNKNGIRFMPVEQFTEGN